MVQRFPIPLTYFVNETPLKLKKSCTWCQKDIKCLILSQVKCCACAKETSLKIQVTLQTNLTNCSTDCHCYNNLAYTSTKTMKTNIRIGLGTWDKPNIKQKYKIRKSKLTFNLLQLTSLTSHILIVKGKWVVNYIPPASPYSTRKFKICLLIWPPVPRFVKEKSNFNALYLICRHFKIYYLLLQCFLLVFFWGWEDAIIYIFIAIYVSL